MTTQTLFEAALDRVSRVDEIRVTGQFDYGVLDESTRTFVQSKTELIHRLSKVTAARMMEIARAFQGIHDRLPRGLWTLWLECESGWPRGSVHRLLQVHATFGDLDISGADVTTSALYALSLKSVPEPAKSEARAIIKSGQPLRRAEAEQILVAHESRTASFPPRAIDLRETNERAEQNLVLAKQTARTLADYDRLISEIEGAVINLRVALANAYGSPISPRPVRDALSRIEELLAGQGEEVPA